VEQGDVVIRHVVIWQLNGDTKEDKKARFEALAPSLRALAGQIEGLLSLQVSLSTGPNPNNWDMCLVSEHDSWEALDVYAHHPAHLAVAEAVAQHTSARAGADFEL